MKSSPRLFSISAVVACMLASVGCGGHSGIGLPSTTAGTQPLSRNAVPTSIPLIKNDLDKSGFHLQVSVAGTKMRDFLFDTGTGGFWVYKNALRKHKDPITDLHIQAHNKYGSGLYYEGELVETTVSFGAGLTIAQLPLVEVESAHCVTTACTKEYGSGSNIIRTLEKERGLWGTFGADLEPRALSNGSNKGELYNGLFGLGAAWTRFGVTPTALEASPSTHGLLNVPMKVGPKTNGSLPNGAQSWQRNVSICYMVGNGSKQYFNGCLPTLFDTGASGVSFRANAIGSMPTEASQHCGTILAAANNFVLETSLISGVTVGSFVSGVTQNWNEAKPATPAPGEPQQVNTGLTFYNRNEIIFDAMHGSISFKHLHPTVRNFVRKCST